MSTINISRHTVFLVLIITFGIVFIHTPIWQLPESRFMQQFFLVISIGGGWVWARHSSGDLTVSIHKSEWGWLGFTFVFSLALQYRYLTSVVPFMGDERYHIETARLILELYKNPVMIVLPGLIALLFITRKSRVANYIVMVIFLAALILGSFANYSEAGYVTKYPVLNKYITLPFTYTAYILKIPPNEWIYRMPSFLASVLLIWYASSKLGGNSKPLRLLSVITIATIPVLAFYSSILYIEIPIAFLLLVVAFNMEELLTQPFEEIKRMPAWYALIAVGYLKEPVFLFLAAFLATRFAFRFYTKWKNRSGLDWTGEFLVVVGTAFPIMLQLTLIKVIGPIRHYIFVYDNLFNREINSAVFTSYWDSFSLFFPLSVLGTALMFKKKKYDVAICFSLFALFNYLFWTMDWCDYWGLPRYNLFIFPVAVMASIYLLSYISKRQPYTTLGILAGMLILNFFMSPLQADGTKKNDWGEYFGKAEYYLPYRDAISHLCTFHADKTIMSSGTHYQYDCTFYSDIFSCQFEVRYEAAADVDEALNTAIRDNIGVIVYQFIHPDTICLDREDFTIEQRFQNKAGTLYIITRPES